MSSTATASPGTDTRASSVASSSSKRSTESNESSGEKRPKRLRIEAPPLHEFTKEYGIPMNQFAWGARPESSEEESFDEDETNIPPSIPRYFRKYPRPKGKTRCPVNHAPRAILRNYATMSPEPAPVPAPQLQPQALSERSLLDFPVEIREEIYRGLLVSHKPVPVYDGWKRVYVREKPCLDINILMVCKKIFNEAIGVLYGENTFLYRLRDMPTQSHVMVNIQELAQSNAYVPERGHRETYTDMFDDDEAEAVHQPGTINVKKYACLFRYITLQADHNRSQYYTQEFMADAINMFAQAPSMTNIHTLTIIISPRYTRGSFTFVDWFNSESELVGALKAVCCEIIRIKIWNKHLNDGIDPLSTELFLRAHHLRFFRQLKKKRLQDGKPDIWAGDWKMERLRLKRCREVISSLEKLRPCVLEACKKHLEPDVKRRGDLGDADEDGEEDEVMSGEAEEDLDDEFVDDNDSDDEASLMG